MSETSPQAAAMPMPRCCDACSRSVRPARWHFRTFGPSHGGLHSTHFQTHVLSLPDTVWGVDIAQGPPDGAITLEAGAEGNLPHAIASPHSGLRLNVGQHIPASAESTVTLPVQLTLLSNGCSAVQILMIVSP